MGKMAIFITGSSWEGAKHAAVWDARHAVGGSGYCASAVLQLLNKLVLLHTSVCTTALGRQVGVWKE